MHRCLCTGDCVGMPQEPGADEPPEAQRTPVEPVELGDLAALRALAHPRRQRVLQHLALHGPATSATLARALGLNTGATSYHLRELARYGFVEEPGGTGTGHRERWRWPPCTGSALWRPSTCVARGPDYRFAR